ncbi:MAG: acetyl-CoA carboxylase biotin carboxyl carrier protein [Fidelibacterota bacterium]|nr:MAG: acetyl-CoA carboxylase biotin carboxyl carrier protein [Candidatus Neomarinimicrobiota bacterium]
MFKDKIKELIAIVEESNVHEVEVSTWWGRKIRVQKNSSFSPNSSSAAEVQAGSPLTVTTSSGQGPEVVAEEPVSEAERDYSKLHQITAPIVGTFYRAPSPDSAPYINVGDKVSAGQVICIIEAMKIMNEIESDANGTVVDILVENTNPVEYNQPLIVVDPS